MVWQNESFFRKKKCLGVKYWPNVYDMLRIPKVPFIKQHWRIQCTPKGFFHYDKRIHHCILGDSKVICLTLWLINIVTLWSFFTPALIIKRTKNRVIWRKFIIIFLKLWEWRDVIILIDLIHFLHYNSHSKLCFRKQVKQPFVAQPLDHWKLSKALNG